MKNSNSNKKYSKKANDFLQKLKNGGKYQGFRKFQVGGPQAPLQNPFGQQDMTAFLQSQMESMYGSQLSDNTTLQNVDQSILQTPQVQMINLQPATASTVSPPPPMPITPMDTTAGKIAKSLPVIGGIAAIGLGAKELREGIQAKRRANRRQKDYQADLKERMDDIAMGEYVNTPYNAKFGGVMNYFQNAGEKKGEPLQLGQTTRTFQVTDSGPQRQLNSQEIKAIQAKKDQQVLAERKARLEKSKQAKGKPISAQQIADESGAIGDKFRIFPEDPNSIIDNYLNPAVMIGDLASGLGQVPLNIQEGNYGQAAMNVAAPLVTGALLGGKNVTQLANNLANPLAGAGEFLTTQTPLKNAYKLNPFAFKPNSEAYYRMVGKDGLTDAIESGIIRANPKTGKFNAPYFSKGQPSGSYAGPNMVEYKADDVIFPKQSFFDYASPLETINIENPNLKFYTQDWLRGFKEVPKPLSDLSSAKNIKQAGLIDTKGAFQKYPKGNLTAEEISAFKNTSQYKKAVQEQSDLVKRYGKDWNLPNYADEAITNNDRNIINPVLYGGRNWSPSDYVIAGLVGTSYPAAVGIHGLVASPTAVKNKALNKAGVYDPTRGQFLSNRDTTIDITNRPMGAAKVNEITQGQMIIGGEFIEDSNNTVRKAKDWLTATDTYSDKNYSSKDIKSFYGVENGKFKVGKASDFNPETEIVPRRFGEANISKAILNEDKMRLLDSKGEPIYHNTPNSGKFILYSPSTGKSQFTYINSGKSGVEKVNAFLKSNKDAQYIHLDNGRYEYYGNNPKGLTQYDFQKYYEQDLSREGNPGYNLIIRGEDQKFKYGGMIKRADGTYSRRGLWDNNSEWEIIEY